MKNIQIIDLIRGLCILLVWAVHLNQSGTTIPYQDARMNHFWITLSQNGSYGVTLFFVISGFLITRLIYLRSGDLFRPDFREFYVRRLGRIFPLLLLVVLLGLTLIHFAPASKARDICLWDPHSSLSGPFWASILTFSFNWYRIANEHISVFFGMNWDVLWSLSIEEQFYLFYPFALSRLKTENHLRIFLAFFLVAGPLSRWCAHLVNPDSFLLAFTNSFGAFDQMAMGVLLFLTIRRFKENAPDLFSTSLKFMLVGSLLMFFAYFRTDLTQSKDRIFGPSLISLGLFLFLLGAIRLKFFQNRFWSWLSLPGKTSYGGYLLHSVILFSIWPFLIYLHPLTALMAFALATTLAATLSFYFFEKPMNRFIYKIFIRREKIEEY